MKKSNGSLPDQGRSIEVMIRALAFQADNARRILKVAASRSIGYGCDMASSLQKDSASPSPGAGNLPETVPLFIGGRWQQSSATTFSPVHNPSTGEVIAQTPLSGESEVDAAVTAAQKAFASWSTTPATRRAKILFDCRQRVQQHFDELSRLICQGGTEHSRRIAFSHPSNQDS